MGERGGGREGLGSEGKGGKKEMLIALCCGSRNVSPIHPRILRPNVANFHVRQRREPCREDSRRGSRSPTLLLLLNSRLILMLGGME